MDQHIAHYRITGRLGAGAMGVVYRAQDERLGRDVALKVLPADDVGDEAARKRLAHEARTASALNHPNICTIYDVGEADGQIYLVMEFVAGRPLDRVLAEGPMTADAVRIGVQLADAVAHAHHHGIVHRDLKAGNIVLTAEGRPKILDFGLATRSAIVGTGDHMTVSAGVDDRTISGTIPYMAPEVLRGQPVDARSDIWALGVILFEMAAGHRPFQADTTFDLASAIMRDPAPPLPEAAAPGLADVVRRCLEKDPAQRYQSAAELKAALEAIGSTTFRSTPRVRRGRLIAAIAMTAIAAAALLVGLDAGGLRQKLFARPAPAAVRSLAVLPLENLSGDANQDYFSDGMTEALISDLAQIRALRVISRTSAMRYKGSKQSLPAIARELGVDAIVEGSVLRSGDKVRVTAQLIYAPTDTHLWGHDYERQMSDVLRLQNEVAAAIADEIRIEVTPGEHERLSAAPVVNPAAHEAYLLGRHFWNARTDEGLQRSIQYFQQAIDTDPKYALAYAGLADAYAILAGYGPVPPREALPKARAAATKAIELDSRIAEAHTSLAYVLTIYDFDWMRGGEEFRRAIELNPGYATGHHWYGHYLMFLGRFDEAIAEMQRARDLDPLSPIITTEVGYPRFFAGQYDAAIEDYRKAIDLSPEFFRAYWLLGQAYEQEHRYPEAIEALQKAVKLSDSNPVMTAALAHAWALAGRRAEAQAALDRLMQVSRDKYFSPYFIAEIHLALGHRDEALAWLGKAYDARDYFLRWLRIDPRLETVRDDPRFHELEHRMRYPDRP
jgi:TolB-like protein/Tfp pilus assembly protein PilF/tRNA A-37 threonylcarbamoyl transferase component Bud32